MTTLDTQALPTVVRWHAAVHYRADAGMVDVHHDLIELEELHDLIERGPHWATIARIEVTYVGLGPDAPETTIETARTL
jgi:hypothetical protein